MPSCTRAKRTVTRATPSPLPATSGSERQCLRRGRLHRADGAGARGDLYDRMLAELSQQAKLADQLDYDSISFTEHHFHVEGFELSNNPILLDLFIAMQTQRLRVGQLGIVLPSHNPLRVAEDI